MQLPARHAVLHLHRWRRAPFPPPAPARTTQHSHCQGARFLEFVVRRTRWAHVTSASLPLDRWLHGPSALRASPRRWRSGLPVAVVAVVAVVVVDHACGASARPGPHAANVVAVASAAVAAAGAEQDKEHRRCDQPVTQQLGIVLARRRHHQRRPVAQQRCRQSDGRGGSVRSGCGAVADGVGEERRRCPRVLRHLACRLRGDGRSLRHHRRWWSRRSLLIEALPWLVGEISLVARSSGAGDGWRRRMRARLRLVFVVVFLALRLHLRVLHAGG